MKSMQLHAKLAGLAKSDNLLEIIKDCELSKIKGGGDCPKLTSCTIFVECSNVFKSGDKDTTITPTVGL